MTEAEKMDLILSEVQGMRSEMTDLKSEVSELKSEIRKLSLHVENETDRNVQLLAENFIDLTNKLNQAVPAANKNLAYEVKVNYLIDEVEKLKQNVAAILNKTA